MCVWVREGCLIKVVFLKCYNYDILEHSQVIFCIEKEGTISFSVPSLRASHRISNLVSRLSRHLT